MITQNYSIHLLYIKTLSCLMGDSTTAGPRTRARRRPWSPGSSFRLIRVQHITVSEITLPVLSTMSLVPQLYVMLQQNRANAFNTPASSNCNVSNGSRKGNWNIVRVAGKTWEHTANVSR